MDLATPRMGRWSRAWVARVHRPYHRWRRRWRQRGHEPFMTRLLHVEDDSERGLAETASRWPDFFRRALGLESLRAHGEFLGARGVDGLLGLAKARLKCETEQRLAADTSLAKKSAKLERLRGDAERADHLATEALRRKDDYRARLDQEEGPLLDEIRSRLWGRQLVTMILLFIGSGISFVIEFAVSSNLVIEALSLERADSSRWLVALAVVPILLSFHLVYERLNELAQSCFVAIACLTCCGYIAGVAWTMAVRQPPDLVNAAVAGCLLLGVLLAGAVLWHESFEALESWRKARSELAAPKLKLHRLRTELKEATRAATRAQAEAADAREEASALAMEIASRHAGERARCRQRQCELEEGYESAKFDRELEVAGNVSLGEIAAFRLRRAIAAGLRSRATS